MEIGKVIFSSSVVRDLQRLVMNTRPIEQWAYLLGEISEDVALVRDFVHDASSSSTQIRAEPDWRYLAKAYELKKRLAPGKVDIVAWFHSHPLGEPSETDIASMKSFQRTYEKFGSSFGCFMNYNSLKMKCFYIEDNEPRYIPFEVVTRI